MKKYLIFFVFAILTVYMLYVIGCTPKGIPVTGNLGTPNAYPTAGSAVFPVLYNDGTQSTSITAAYLYDGNATASLGYATLNPQDYVDKGAAGDAYSYQVSWSTSAIANMNGYSGMILDGNSINFVPYTTCTFWAKANQAVTVQFQVAGSGNNPEVLSTTWTQYSIAVPSGSATGYFAILIIAAPATAPLNVEFDRVVFNGLVMNTPTMTNTLTVTNTPGGATSTSTATMTVTATSTLTATNTVTSTPGSPTSTPNAGSATFPVLYQDGALSSIVTSTSSFDGNNNNAANFATLNATDSTIGNGYGTDWYGYLAQYTASELSGFSGWTTYGPYTGFTLAGASTDFSAYTTCKFWAKANEAASVGFNAAELDSNDNGSVPESLTTNWAQFTLNIVPGSRSDSFSDGSTLTGVTTYFVEVLTNLPGSEPLNVSVDQVVFQ